MPTDESIQGRDLLPWQDLSAYFWECKGLGLGFRTLPTWHPQAWGMPFTRDGQKQLVACPAEWRESKSLSLNNIVVPVARAT